MKLINLFLILLINSWTVLYSQTGDTLTCYTNSQLQKIANKLVYANECDTLLKIAEKQLFYKDSAIFKLQEIIELKEEILSNKDSIISIQDTIIFKKNENINLLVKDNNKLKRQKKFLKIGTTTLGALLLGTATYAILK